MRSCVCRTARLYRKPKSPGRFNEQDDEDDVFLDCGGGADQSKDEHNTDANPDGTSISVR
jgi:hypothetical protein